MRRFCINVAFKPDRNYTVNKIEPKINLHACRRKRRVGRKNPIKQAVIGTLN